MKRLILVRHGETDWTASRRLQGHTDLSLNETGRAQVRTLVPLLTSLAPDVVLTSDLHRATETAAILGYPAAVRLPALREQGLGAWEGNLIDDLLAQSPGAYHDWRAGCHTPPGGEDWAAFCARIEAVLRDAAAQCRQSALIACHGGVIRAALNALIRLPPQHIVPVGPASVTILALDEAGFRLQAFNLRAIALSA